MTRIGLLSDTHSYLDPRVLEHFADVDEIWHAGDIGSAMVLQHLREFKPTRAVYGNMDSGDVRYSLSEFYRFPGYPPICVISTFTSSTRKR